MADPNEAGFSAPASDWSSFAGSLRMPDEFAAFFSPSRIDVALDAPPGASPGSSTQLEKSRVGRGSKKVRIEAESPTGNVVRRRASVVDGRGPVQEPEDEEFAPPPLVHTSARAASISRDGEAPSDDHFGGRGRGGGGRGRGRGRGGGGGGRGGRRMSAAGAAVALASNVTPLVQHQRVRAGASDRPAPRALDDVDDAVDDSDGAASEEPPEEDRVDDDDEPNDAEHEAAAAAFDHSAWTQIAASGLSEFHTPVPEQPLPAAQGRRVTLGDIGAEVPMFQQNYQAGPIKGTLNTALPSRGCTSTLAFVRLLFSEEMVDKLCVATNAAARDHPRCKDLVRVQRSWKPLEQKEMYLWLALCTYLGVVKIQNRKCAWARRGIFRQKWMAGQMSLERFECILTCVNFSDHWNLSEEDFRRKNKEYCFWQIEELVSLANTNNQAYFRLGHRIDVDEAVIPWKGRHKARCYNSKKPWKFHFKKFMLNDADTGYNYNFYYYGGKEEARPADMPATCYPVVRLLSTTNPSLCHKNHLVALDNWFTSSKTHSWLAQHGFSGVGTIGPNKLGLVTPKRPAGFPNGGIMKKAATRCRGAYIVHKGKLVAGDGQAHDCYVTAWQDRHPVHVFSTYPPALGSCKRKVKVNGEFVQGDWPRPSVVHHYNKSMGGTDLHDQRVAYYRTCVKSKRWQVRLLTDMFSSLLQNAFILYKGYHDKSKKYDSRQFIEAFLSEVAEWANPPDGDDSSDSDANAPMERNAHKRDWWISGPGASIRLKGRDHWPQRGGNTFRTHNQHTNTKYDLRRYCIFHPTLCGRVSTYCTKCMVPLCLAHFEAFHRNSSDHFPVLLKKPRNCAQ